jgi:hypothetical protein
MRCIFVGGFCPWVCRGCIMCSRFIRSSIEVKIKKVKLLVEQKIYIYIYCIISASCLVICPAYPFPPKVVCCLKSVYYKDVPLWRVNPRNINDSLYSVFYGVQICHSRETHWVFCVQCYSSGSRYVTADNYRKMEVSYEGVPTRPKPEHCTQQ